MANKFPLILNTSANQIQEIASGDNLDLTGCKIVGLDGINSGGIVTFTKSHVGAATTWGEDLVVTGNARVTGILTVGTNSVTISGNDVNITGVTTASNFKTGTSNLHNVGIELAGINVLGADTPIGTGATIYDAGGAVFTGVVTATNYVGTINTPAQPNITSLGTLSALNVSGNVSIGGTLTYEDVTNIDAVGLITARNGINVSGGTATFAAAIDANSDLDVDGHTNLDNVSIAGVTTAAGAIDLNADLDVDGHTNLDNVSIAGVSTIADNSKLAFGTGEDLSLYHLTADNDGYIKYQNENGHLKIGSGAGANGGIQLWNRTYNKSYLTCDSDNAVKIYFNNSKKIETTNTGAIITGICTATTMSSGTITCTDWFTNNAAGEGMRNSATGQYLFSQASNETRIYHGSNNQIKLTFRGNGDVFRGAVDAQPGFIQLKTGADESAVVARDNTTVELYFNGSKKIETSNTGAVVTGLCTATTGIHIPDDQTIKIGNTSASPDLTIQHISSNSSNRIHATTGYIQYRAVSHFINDENNSVNFIRCEESSSNKVVKLACNGATKLETKPGGIELTGAITANGALTIKTDDVDFIAQDSTDSTTNFIWRDHSASKLYLGVAGSAVIAARSDVTPYQNNTYNLGTTALRWANAYVNDMHFSNEGSSNSVDGTWGDWTLQEGDENIFMLNNRTGKKYKMNLTEVS